MTCLQNQHTDGAAKPMAVTFKGTQTDVGRYNWGLKAQKINCLACVTFIQLSCAHTQGKSLTL